MTQHYLTKEQIALLTLWEVREVYGFKVKRPNLSFQWNFFQHHRAGGKNDLEIYLLWQRHQEQKH